MKNDENIYDFLKESNFELITEETSEFFGDHYLIFSNGSFQLKFSSSKSFETVDIRSNLPSESWYDLTLIKAMLYDEKQLNNVTTIEEYSTFLQKELTNISKLFMDRNYPATKKRLEKLGNIRIIQMFPKTKK